MKSKVLAIITVSLALTLTACGSSSTTGTAPIAVQQEETETAVQSDVQEQVEEIVSEPVVLCLKLQHDNRGCRGNDSRARIRIHSRRV